MSSKFDNNNSQRKWGISKKKFLGVQRRPTSRRKRKRPMLNFTSNILVPAFLAVPLPLEYVPFPTLTFWPFSPKFSHILRHHLNDPRHRPLLAF